MENAQKKVIQLPHVVFGTSPLGNLYVAKSDEEKCSLVREWIAESPQPAVFDTAGKYGAGLALESLGHCLRNLGVKPGKVMISNKLGWYRIPLTGPEPTFEPGVWINLTHDAEQRISYQGILDCYHQGLELLDGYQTGLVSVHDPDEYLAAATSEEDKAQRFEDVKEAYRALFELKAAGKVDAVGVGAKDWHIIKQITDVVDLDWVMIANSMTLHSHPADLWAYMQDLSARGVTIINSAVFNGGFLTGGKHYNYKPVSDDNAEGAALLQWREKFFAVCEQFNITPAHACVQFAVQAPGVQTLAIGTTVPEKIKPNIEMVDRPVPEAFWRELESRGLIKADVTTKNLIH
jgi:D-threo-aldose 1-dehydrogenase